MILFICGNAQSGKDTLYKIISDIVGENVTCDRFALADELKCVLNPFTRDNFGISSFTNDIDDKNLIRPIMVEVARAFRTKSKGTYWTNILQPKIDASIAGGNLPIITDGRFCEYEHDEVWWAKNKNNGIIIHVSRTLPNGEYIRPANYEESANEQGLIRSCDYQVRWPTSDDKLFLSDLVKIQLKDLIEKICQKYPNSQTKN